MCFARSSEIIVATVDPKESSCSLEIVFEFEYRSIDGSSCIFNLTERACLYGEGIVERFRVCHGQKRNISWAFLPTRGFSQLALG